MQRHGSAGQHGHAGMEAARRLAHRRRPQRAGPARCRRRADRRRDGNEDPVAPLLRGFDDPRLSVVRVPHGGECAGRNAGIAVARGRYLRFVDADDVLDPHSTARLLELVEGRDDVLAYLATVFCDEDLEPIWTMSARTRGAALVDCLLNQSPVRLPAMLFPRAVIDLTGAWDTSFRVCQDWDFCLRAVEHAEVRGGDGVGVFYRRHGDSATADTTAGSEGRRAVVERFFERHPEQRGTGLQRRALGMLRARDARIALQRGHVADGGPARARRGRPQPARGGHRIRPGAARGVGAWERGAPLLPGRPSRRSPERRAVHRALLRGPRGGLRELRPAHPAGGACAHAGVVGARRRVRHRHLDERRARVRRDGRHGRGRRLGRARGAGRRARPVRLSRPLRAARSRPGVRPGALPGGRGASPRERRRHAARLAHRHAPAVLFSAAIPFQGGRHHVNEQWQSHWIGRFAELGLGVHDVVRPAVWTDPAVEPWYAQNTLLFIEHERAAALGLDPEVPVQADVVHPGLHTIRHAQPALKPSLRLLPRAVRTDSRRLRAAARSRIVGRRG